MGALAMGGTRKRAGRGWSWRAGVIAMALAMALPPAGAMALIAPGAGEVVVVDERPGVLPGELLANIDGYFTENLGQLDPGIRYYCMGSPLSVAFGDSWVGYDYRPEGGDRGVMFRVTFDGANAVRPVGLEPTACKSSFFIGNDPEHWISGASTFRGIVFRGLYDGVDLSYMLHDGRLKYEFLVAPGADHSSISMRYDGIAGLAVDAVGDLIIRTPNGVLRDDAPISFYEGLAGRDAIPSMWSLADASSVRFTIGRHDTGRPLIIDPDMAFSTVIGGSEHDQYPHCRIDQDGTIVIAGRTLSTDFPITPGSYDTSYSAQSGFLLWLSDDGSELLSSTFYGEAVGTNDIAIDASGNIYVTGWTQSATYPTTAGAFDGTLGGGCDAFVSCFNSTGSDMLFSTLFGGQGIDEGRSISFNSEGEACICGETGSNDLPTVPGCYDPTFNGNMGSSTGDLFLVVLNSNLSKEMHFTYLGGTDEDIYVVLCVDGNDDIYLTGETLSSDFPMTSSALDTQLGGIDAFLVKFDRNCTDLKYSSFLGGGGFEIGRSIVLDDSGRIYLSGPTSSLAFPVTDDAFQSVIQSDVDLFFTVVNASGDKLLYSTYLGGDGEDESPLLALISDGSIAMTFVTGSTDMPVTDDAYDETKDAGWDCFFCTFVGEPFKLEYATYLGGSTSDKPSGIACGDSYAIIAGHTDSVDFPVTDGAYDTTVTKYDCFVTRFGSFSQNGTRPSPPVNLSSVALDRAIRLDWDAPMYDGGCVLKGYNVYRGDRSDNLTLISVLKRWARDLTDRSVNLGSMYFYSISALNRMGESNRTDVVNATAFGRPVSPTGLTAIAGCQTIAVNWTPPNDTGALPILGYRLYRGSSAISLSSFLGLGDIDRYMDEGLENGREYFYRVLAFNAMGDGENSTIVSAMPRGPPSMPQFFSVMAGDAMVTLQWRIPMSDEGSPVLGYNILRGSDETTLSLRTGVGQFDNIFTDTGLTNGVTYFYAVQAFNAIGSGPSSEVLNATPLGVPGMVKGLTITSGDGQVFLSWAPPTLDGGTPLLGYHLLCGNDPDNLGTGFPVQGTTYTDQGLTNGQRYCYAVRAYNKLGDGPLSAVVEAIPLGFPSPPTDLFAEAGNGVVTISWLAPMETGGAPFVEYRVYCGSSPSALELLRTLIPSARTLRDVDVVVGTPYYYAVSAVTEAGEGPRSPVASATPYGWPSAPVNITVTAGDGEVSLSWSPPASDGAAAIEGYVILRRTSSTDLQEFETLTGVLTYKDRTVMNGVTYHYAIVAVNKAGRGPATEAVSATPFKPATVPGKVRTLLAEAKGAKVTLAWTAPESDGGSPVTGYVVLRGASRDALAVVATLGAVTVWTDAAVERGSTYYYTVAAVNSVGQGEAFAAYEVKVPKEKEDGPGFGAIGMGVALAAAVLVMASQRRRHLDQ